MKAMIFEVVVGLDGGRQKVSVPASFVWTRMAAIDSWNWVVGGASATAALQAPMSLVEVAYQSHRCQAMVWEIEAFFALRRVRRWNWNWYWNSCAAAKRIFGVKVEWVVELDQLLRTVVEIA